MKVLIVGSGGREHAIGWKISQDAKKSGKEVNLFFSPGNGYTQNLGENIKVSSLQELSIFAYEQKIDFTIVGPEIELAEGIVDIFQTKGLKIFGPNKKAAQLESSKAYSKNFMKKHGIKTADYKVFTKAFDAIGYLNGYENYPIVVKASGLAAGKGVLICESKQEAIQAVQEIMVDHSFGNAGEEVVIEEFLTGFEASILSVNNGKSITPFISAMDHKKIDDGELGLNTGGMGVVSPNPKFTEAHQKDFIKNILEPTQKGLAEDGLLFSGVIFFGLMITEKGTYLLEYNLRMGDPETQATLPLMDSDLLEVYMDAEKGKELDLKWKDEYSCCVVMASGGYPKAYQKGFEIEGLDKVIVPYFIAGAEEKEGKLKTTGGRVLSVVGIGKTRTEAHEKAYAEIKKISFENHYYRKDIGKNA